MSDVIAVCDVCGHELGVFDPLKVHLPLRGDMFRSIDPFHGWPDPFPASVDWRYMECPRCTMRPFEDESVIKDKQGNRWKVTAIKPAPEPPAAKPTATRKAGKP